MARKKRRNIEAFSLSFLDCICCGFGAIILLLVISKIYEPVVIEEAENNLEPVYPSAHEDRSVVPAQPPLEARGATRQTESKGSGSLQLLRDHWQLAVAFLFPNACHSRLEEVAGPA